MERQLKELAIANMLSSSTLSFSSSRVLRERSLLQRRNLREGLYPLGRKISIRLHFRSLRRRLQSRRITPLRS
jgi:hypothetical protein